MFGNGHVGRALVQVLGALPCAVTWVDEREQDFPEAVPPNVAMVATDVRLYLHIKVREGKIAYVYEYTDRDEALRASGLGS